MPGHSPSFAHLLLFAALLPATCFAAEQAPRERFRSVTPTTFDAGGAPGRQFHLETAAYLEMATIARTGPARALEEAPRADVAALTVTHPGGESTLTDYVATNPWVDAAIVLHRGRVVFEAYPRMAPWQRHLSWSVSKAITATALAALVAEERVDMARPVTDYVPALADSVWAQSSVRDVAAMASGVDCRDSDGYQDTRTCIYRLEEALGLTPPTGYDDGLEAHLRAMARRGPSGQRNEYVSANTTVLGILIENVTGQSFARVLQDRLWAPMGGEADGLVAISPEGFAVPHSGVALRLRDLARFGDLLARPGRFGVVTQEVLADMQGSAGISFDSERRAALARTFGDDAPVRTAWQWDLIWADGALYKGGYSGQGLYVDPARELVVAFFGTGEDYSAKRNAMRGIARQLARSGLFDGDEAGR